MKSFIKINDPTIVQEKTLSFTLSFSRDMNKYFKNDKIYIEYEEDISEIPTSILAIPALAGTILVGWHAGADVYINEIDDEFMRSIEKIKSIFTKWYPKLPFSIIFASSKITNSVVPADQYGMLFSGGLDCAATYIGNREKKLHLYYCFPQERQHGINIDHLKTFAEQESVQLSTIKTNIRDIVDTHLMLTKFGVEWWGQISHAMVFTSLCAPLAFKHKIQQLFISSSFTKELDIPYGSDPRIDNNIVWANCRVVHFGYDMTRQDKTRLLKEFIQTAPGGENIVSVMTLVSWGCIKTGENNKAGEICGKCSYYRAGTGHVEKCLLNIVGFTLEGFDPNIFGFQVDEDTFSIIRKGFQTHKLYKRNWLIKTKADDTVSKIGMFFWKDKQQNIPSQNIPDMYKSREFFKWLKEYNLADYQAKDPVLEKLKKIVPTIKFLVYPLYKSIISYK